MPRSYPSTPPSPNALDTPGLRRGPVLRSRGPPSMPRPASLGSGSRYSHRHSAFYTVGKPGAKGLSNEPQGVTWSLIRRTNGCRASAEQGKGRPTGTPGLRAGQKVQVFFAFQAATRLRVSRCRLDTCTERLLSYSFTERTALGKLVCRQNGTALACVNPLACQVPCSDREGPRDHQPSRSPRSAQKQPGGRSEGVCSRGPSPSRSRGKAPNPQAEPLLQMARCVK